MERSFHNDLAYGLEMEQRAKTYLEKKYPGAKVTTMPPGSKEQKDGIDLIMEHGDRTIRIQVKSRPNAPDICLEGHWDEEEWQYDWPDADYYLYHLPKFRDKPLWIPIPMLDVTLGTHTEEFDLESAPVHKNRDDKKSCRYVKPTQLQRFINMRKIQLNIHEVNNIINKHKTNKRWTSDDFILRKNRWYDKKIVHKIL